MNYRFNKSRNNDGVGSKKTTLESIQDEEAKEEVKDPLIKERKGKAKKVAPAGDPN